MDLATIDVLEAAIRVGGDLNLIAGHLADQAGLPNPSAMCSDCCGSNGNDCTPPPPDPTLS